VGANEEIEQLKEALAASPNNAVIRNMLIKKMEAYPSYHAELENLLQDALRAEPHNLMLKENLINIYFIQDKISTCIVIGEEIGVGRFSDDTKIKLAKCYLREGNNGSALELYKSVLDKNPSKADEELDNAFRLTSVQGDVQELENSILFTKPDIDFSHVGGMDAVKREIDLKIIKPLENVELYASYGKKVGGGILLYGPPGCGKTYIAKATAGQINANFINISLDDILDMYIGNSEKNLNRYFDLARSHKPCVIFFDEVDALGAKRSDMRQSAGRNVINQFLAELDGINSDNEGLLIIGATNAPWHIDPAFRRPGRFDRIIFVPPPDNISKQEILKLKLNEKPQKNIDYKKVAQKTDDYSGADINAIIDIAVESILEEAINTGVPRPIETKDLLAATKKHRPSTLEWFTTAKNYALFANKSGLYDDVLKYLK